MRLYVRDCILFTTKSPVVPGVEPYLGQVHKILDGGEVGGVDGWTDKWRSEALCIEQMCVQIRSHQ